MAPLTALFLAASLLSTNLVSADDQVHTLPVYRNEPQDVIPLARRGGIDYLPTELGKSLYWFGNFSVGDTPNLRLLLDTGSSDLIINNGLYKPSIHKKPYGTGHFAIHYEGVNRAGFGFEQINGTTERDVVTSGNLTVGEQAIGNSVSFKYFDVKPLPFANPGDGIIGFLGTHSSSFHPPAHSWVFNLCRSKSLAECRFGLAFGTSGVGQIAIGTLASNLINGSLVELQRYRHQQPTSFTVLGDVTVDNEIFEKDQVIIMDVGTDNIQGPLGPTRKILKKWGMQTHLDTQTTNLFGSQKSKVLEGYFPCDSPPTLGFSFPAQSQLQPGQTATNFNVSPDVWAVYKHKHDRTNCTSILGGQNALTNPANGNSAWLLGQSFFAGHYIDFDIMHPNYIGFGNLADPSGTQ